MAAVPYIWNEIKFNIACESDLEFVSKTLRDIAPEDIAEAMLDRVLPFARYCPKHPWTSWKQQYLAV